MRPTALFAALITLVSLRPVASQEPGQRIRFSTDSAPSRRATGTLVARDADSLRILLAGRTAPVAVARTSVTRLEVSRGRRRVALDGFGAGFVLGFIVGADAGGRREGAHGCPDGFSGLCALDMEAQVYHDGVLGGVVGGLVGAALGFAVRTERWEKIPLAF